MEKNRLNSRPQQGQQPKQHSQSEKQTKQTGWNQNLKQDKNKQR